MRGMPREFRRRGTSVLRTSIASILLGTAIAVPVLLVIGGMGVEGWLDRVVAGGLVSVDEVGWVLVPQVAVAVGVLGLALERIIARVAGVAPQATPSWLDPAVESALLLGMLGTLSGMVSGFAGLSPDALEPGPLVYSLGTALRSSFVGFGIALVGVWARDRTAPMVPVPE
jgi:hypothetical protein